MYLQLFHGRKTTSEPMDDWGSDGPVFGPLSFVHTTYGSNIHLGEPKEPFDTLGDLHVVEGLVYYDGVYYGDWSVFSELNKELKQRLVGYEESKSVKTQSDVNDVLVCENCAENTDKIAEAYKVAENSAIVFAMSRAHAELKARVRELEEAAKNALAVIDEKHDQADFDTDCLFCSAAAGLRAALEDKE